tara:strand:- start:318 stop:1532 length:1215 start_codon:yes stop_codon:yes gene_type:complete
MSKFPHFIDAMIRSPLPALSLWLAVAVTVPAQGQSQDIDDCPGAAEGALCPFSEDVRPAATSLAPNPEWVVRLRDRQEEIYREFSESGPYTLNAVANIWEPTSRPNAIANDPGLLEEALRIEAELNQFTESLCSSGAHWMDVEAYQSQTGPTPDFVNAIQVTTGLLRWNRDLNERFGSAPGYAGNVNGQHWCSGTLIADNLFLTARHCFVEAKGWEFPTTLVGGTYQPLSSGQAAQNMTVMFNYQKDRRNNMRRTRDFPVVRLVEIGDMEGDFGLDYAIIELGPESENGPLPGELFDEMPLNTTIPADQSPITIVQHPNGAAKKVAWGRVMSIIDRRVFYAVDTEGGSSGSGIIDNSGRGSLIGVHTNGGCRGRGYNEGVSISAIARASAIIGQDGSVSYTPPD